jgi:hypothetical protein
MKNKHAQTAFYAIMLAMVLIVLVLAMIPVGKKTHIGLDCENPDLNMFQHGTCIITDFGFAYFFGGLLLIALGILGARIYFGGSS